MPKFPEPPVREALAALGATHQTVPRGAELWRIYFRGSPHPVEWHTFRFFGPVEQSRFDHHLPPPRVQERGMLYAATSVLTCVAEVFQRQRTIDPSQGRPWLVGFALAAPVALLDLGGLWPTAAGASMAIASGQRARARRWSQAVYEAFPDVQGLWYPSSMAGNAPAVALYERASPAVPARPLFHRPLADPSLRQALARVARRLNYAGVEQP